jgi:DNA-binding Xre family transcriptional regulator
MYFFFKLDISKYLLLSLQKKIIKRIMELRIKEIIKSKGLTMQEFSDKLGIARVNLTKTINGNPTKDTLEKIAAALDVPVTELFDPPKIDVITCPHCGGKIKMSKEADKE